MAHYVEVEQAMAMPGLRVVLSPGVPGPWSESAKGILRIKQIPYIKVRQIVGGQNPALRRWTAQETAPAFVYNDERPRSLWNDQLYLAERLAPAPALIPDRAAERVRMFGLANELCGEHGLGWSRRLMILHRGLTNPNSSAAARGFSTFLGNKYGYDAAAAAAAPRRSRTIVEEFAVSLRRSSSMAAASLSAASFLHWTSIGPALPPCCSRFRIASVRCPSAFAACMNARIRR